MHVSEGYVRIVVETSPDGGEPYDRDVIAHGDDAQEFLSAVIRGREALRDLSASRET